MWRTPSSNVAVTPSTLIGYGNSKRRYTSLDSVSAFVVDDVIATGATAEAALKVLRQAGAAHIVLAAAAAERSTVSYFASEADEVVAMIQPARLSSISQWFDDFAQGDRRRGADAACAMLSDSAALLQSVRAAGPVSVFRYAVGRSRRIRADLRRLACVLLPPHALGRRANAAGFGIQGAGRGNRLVLLVVLATPPLLAEIAIIAAWVWYRRVWNRRLSEIWPDAVARSRHSAFRRTRLASDADERESRERYLASLLVSPLWNQAPTEERVPYETAAVVAFQSLESEIVERAFTTGLIVGASGNRYVDLFTILFGRA